MKNVHSKKINFLHENGGWHFINDVGGNKNPVE